MFGEFDSENDARDVYALLPQGWRGFVAKGCQRSPLFDQLQSVCKGINL